tara:strand:+ start:3609 stop:4130 length:522 start_codon:yes stop_codon:yes gene_type:complete
MFEKNARDEEEFEKVLKSTVDMIMTTSAWEQRMAGGDVVVYQHPVVEHEYVRMEKDTSDERWKEILLSPATVGVMIMSGIEARGVTEQVLKNLGAEYKLATEQQIINQMIYLLVVDDNSIENMRKLKKDVDNNDSAYHEYMLFTIAERITEAVAMLLAKKEEGNNESRIPTEM